MRISISHSGQEPISEVHVDGQVFQRVKPKDDDAYKGEDFNSVYIHIWHCTECPYYIHWRTDDLTSQQKCGYLTGHAPRDIHQEDFPIPEWCPLREENKKDVG